MPTRAELQDDFAAFTANNLASLLRIARSLTGDADAADDLTQHSLEKAYRAWAKVMKAEDPLAYVRRIIVNAAYDSWRRLRRFRAIYGVQTDEVEVPAATSWGNPEQSFDSTARLDALLKPLTNKERAVITLRYLVDLSETDTADELGIAVGTVKSTTARALGKMRLAETQLIGG